MTRFYKLTMAVASTGNVQLMTVAEVGQQFAVLRSVPRMIALEAVQLFVDQPGQIFLQARAMEITGQMSAKGNAASLPDHLHHF